LWINLPGYEILEKIYESTDSVAFRALRERDSRPVIVKTLKAEYPSPRVISKYRQEYELVSSLTDVPGIAQILGKEELNNSPVLIVEDFGGESLKSLLRTRSFSIQEALEMGIQIVTCLAQVHAAKIIHKDLNPANIIFNARTKQTKLIDFGISARCPAPSLQPGQPRVLEGTPAYLSPEQAGALNQAIDFRSDYYSLGATLYHLLTGRLPFEGEDPGQSIHCHLNQIAAPPHRLRQEIPPVVSDLVMKLLAKAPEHRYQSAFGIKADLENCLSQWLEKGAIEPFQLGTRDLSSRSLVPPRLYGRGSERAALEQIFERTCQGRKQVALVTGPPGVGKTALVQAFQRALGRKPGLFVAGKFEELEQNTPYSALRRAIHMLIRTLLSAPDPQVMAWKEKLVAALVDYAPVVAEVFPELELLLGPQPVPHKLGLSESQNRFWLACGKLFGVLTSLQRPLCLFLDNLQWADAASILLLEVLLTSADVESVFLLGAYRDGEVDACSPLAMGMEEVAAAGVEVHRIPVELMRKEDIQELLADTLHSTPGKTEPLASLVIERTGGNPLFLNELMESLYSEHLLTPDLVSGTWKWDLIGIRAQPAPDSAAELMMSKLQKLPAEVLQILRSAACLGRQFKLDELSLVCAAQKEEVFTALRSTTDQGLLIPIRDPDREEEPEELRFAHGRIWEALYSLIPEEEKLQIHLRIGRLLLRECLKNPNEQKQYEVLNHINLAIGLIDSEDERIELARLNLAAARRVKEAAAFEQAKKYLLAARALVGAGSWEGQYELTLEITRESAEAAYLCADFDLLQRLKEETERHARTVLEKVAVVKLRIDAHAARNESRVALRLGLEFLRQLGLRLPESPSRMHLFVALIKAKRIQLGRSIEALIDLPEMTDPQKIAAIQIMRSMAVPAYVSNTKLMALMLFVQVNLLARYGHTRWAPSVFAAYGIVLTGILDDIEGGYRFAELALNLVQKHNIRELGCRMAFLVNAYVFHWKRHLEFTLPPMLEGSQQGLLTGDLEFSAFNCHMVCHHSYFLGRELPELEQDLRSSSDSIARLEQHIPLGYNRIFHQVVLNLMGLSEDPCIIRGSACDETTLLTAFEESNDRVGMRSLYCHKLILSCLFRRYGEALKNADLAARFSEDGRALFVLTRLCFYDSLARLKIMNSLPKGERSKACRKVAANLKQLKKWARHAPMNHLHLVRLIEAERHFLCSANQKAANAYTAAIELARQHRYLQEEALAYELAALYYLRRRKLDIAKSYMLEARYAYLRWGATAKVNDLEKKHPDFFSAPGDRTSAGE